MQKTWIKRHAARLPARRTRISRFLLEDSQFSIEARYASSVTLPRVGCPSGACSSRSRGTRDPTGTTCRARCRDGSLSVSVYACFFSCFSDAGSIAKFRGSCLALVDKSVKTGLTGFGTQLASAFRTVISSSGTRNERAGSPFYYVEHGRWGYGVGEKAVFLMRRISRGSIFVKPKHLPPRSFSEAPMRYSSLSSMMRKRSWNSSL